MAKEEKVKDTHSHWERRVIAKEEKVKDTHSHWERRVSAIDILPFHHLGDPIVVFIGCKGAHRLRFVPPSRIPKSEGAIY